MAKIKGKWIETGAISSTKLANSAVTSEKIADSNVTGVKLDSTAKQAVLESKLLARKTGVLNFSASTSSSDVSTMVAAAATIDTPRTDFTSGKGVYVGAVSGARDHKKVEIRVAGTDNGIDDGSGDDVYGVLTESTGVFTVSYKKADGNAYTFAAPTSIDFFFVEIFDMFSQPADSALVPVGGVVDATQADALENHKSSTEAHDADSIDYESITHVKKNIASGSVKVESVISDLDDAIGALPSPTNYTAVDPSVVASHLVGADAAIGAAQDDATQALTDASTAQSTIDTHLNGTSGKHDASEIDYEATAHTKKNIASGSTTTETAISDLDDALGALPSPTNYVAADPSVVADHLVGIDTKLGSVGDQTAEQISLSSVDITNKYVDLASAPKVKEAVILSPDGGPMQHYTTDFTVITDGAVERRLNWDGLGLDGQLEVGDVLRVVYTAVS